MVTVCCRFALSGVFTAPALIVAEPVFPAPAAVRIGAAAAILAGSVIASERPDAPLTVGRSTNLSPAVGVPEATPSVTPSTVAGSVANVCCVESDKRVTM